MLWLSFSYLVAGQSCTVSGWSYWSACSQPSGNSGVTTRTRTIITNGAGCPPLVETRPCNRFNPSIWIGTADLYRDCSYEAMTTGSLGPGIYDFNSSEIQNGAGISAISISGSLKVTVFKGTSFTGDSLSFTSSYDLCLSGGMNDLTQSLLIEPINPTTSFLDCQVSDWSSWSSCSTTCGDGTQTRTRTVTAPQLAGGAACPSLTETQTCNIATCVCQMSNWSAWSSCSATCGGGTQNRTRTVISSNSIGNVACPPLVETQACNTSPCACNVSSWSSWSACSATCGGGTMNRTRTVVSSNYPPGIGCPTLTETQQCNTNTCSCEVSAWSQWTNCTATCGGGSQNRTRTVIATNGVTCPTLTESQSCNTNSCSCQVSNWSEWSSCSAACGGGTMNRTRTVTFSNGGTCPSLKESMSCNTNSCDVVSTITVSIPSTTLYSTITVTPSSASISRTQTTQTTEEKKNNTGAYIGAGVGAAAVIGLAVYMTRRKWSKEDETVNKDESLESSEPLPDRNRNPSIKPTSAFSWTDPSAYRGDFDVYDVRSSVRQSQIASNNI